MTTKLDIIKKLKLDIEKTVDLDRQKNEKLRELYRCVFLKETIKTDITDQPYLVFEITQKDFLPKVHRFKIVPDKYYSKYGLGIGDRCTVYDLRKLKEKELKKKLGPLLDI